MEVQIFGTRDQAGAVSSGCALGLGSCALEQLAGAFGRVSRARRGSAEPIGASRDGGAETRRTLPCSIRWREAFQAWLEPFFRRFDYDFHLEPKQVRVFEGWCAEGGTFRSVMTPKGGGEPQEHGGTYAVLWRLDQSDDTWRIERYVDGFGPTP
jgi:hypothetical protein